MLAAYVLIVVLVLLIWLVVSQHPLFNAEEEMNRRLGMWEKKHSKANYEGLLAVRQTIEEKLGLNFEMWEILVAKKYGFRQVSPEEKRALKEFKRGLFDEGRRLEKHDVDDLWNLFEEDHRDHQLTRQQDG